MKNRLGVRPIFYVAAIVLVAFFLSHKASPVGYQSPSLHKQQVKAPILPRKPKPMPKAVVKSTAPTAPKPVNTMPAPTAVPLTQALAEKHISSPANVELVVRKSSHQLALKVDGEVVRTYIAATGKTPGAKEAIGDKATPVGDYYVCEKNPRSQFYLALKLAYPNISDAKRGVENGLIDQTTCNRIVSAIKSGQAPPMNTRLGGNICIHGGGAARGAKSGEQVRDWTAGCIALNNPQMKELFDFISVGTLVHIRA